MIDICITYYINTYVINNKIKHLFTYEHIYIHTPTHIYTQIPTLYTCMNI